MTQPEMTMGRLLKETASNSCVYDDLRGNYLKDTKFASEKKNEVKEQKWQKSDKWFRDYDRKEKRERWNDKKENDDRDGTEEKRSEDVAPFS